MRIMFHKKDLHGMWFDDGMTDESFTEKVPPDTAHVWDEGQGEWVSPGPKIAEGGEPRERKPTLPDTQGGI